MSPFHEKNICVLGAKRSGRALCELILKLGGKPKVSDKGFDQEFSDWAKDKNIACEFNQHSPKFVFDCDMIVLSPGVSVYSEIVIEAKKRKIPVLGEIEFAYQFCQKPVIAITGSNGKTTVTTLIYETIKSAGFKAHLCGNIGRPFAGYCLDTTVDYFVLEISSFQMESMIDESSATVYFEKGNFKFRGFRPFTAIVLNFSDNHLDRHKDIQEYWDAKTRLFSNQEKKDYALLSITNERFRELAPKLRSQVIFFDREEAMKIYGTKNPNYLAVYEVANVLNIKKEIVEKVIQGFKGVEHRLEWVRTVNGVDFINDSKATTAQAGKWALENMSKPVVMICGGKDKNIDFTCLKEIVRQKVRRMIVFGEAKKKLRDVFKDSVELEEAGDLGDAVTKARIAALKGDSILLSPMCASFDMFKDYEHRGKVFKEIVLQLAAS